MPHTPNYDAKVKAILEATAPGERVCALTGEKWEMTDEEISWYKEFNVPPSKLAPHTRLRQMMGFNAGVSLWWKPHAKTGKPILSFIHPDSPFQVIPDTEWFGEDYADSVSWSPNEAFFDQFRRLAYSIPVGALRDNGSNVRSIGVDLLDCEDVYLSFGCGDARRIQYGVMSGMNSEDSIDIANCGSVRECFSMNQCGQMFDCAYAFRSEDCVKSAFLFDCEDVEYCFGATNKRHKKYLWFNEQLSREEWERRRATVDLSVWSVFLRERQKFLILMNEAVWPDRYRVNSDDCVGEYLFDCVRCFSCWYAIKSTDLFACWTSLNQQSSAFSTWIGRGSDVYQCSDLVYSQGCKFCVRTWRCLELEYCMDCYGCENCFGCFGLRHKQFCIFNHPYTQEEYWMRVDELKSAMLARGEYGQFFPGDLSQNGFQFSMGKMYFDYTTDEYAAFGAPHFDPARGAVIMPKSVSVEGSVSINEIPDALSEMDAALYVGSSIHDATLQRNFSVTESEFAFYKKHQLPFPREHFLSRLKNLAHWSNGPMEESVRCATCAAPITTNKNPTFQNRRVLCRACYLAFLERHS